KELLAQKKDLRWYFNDQIKVKLDSATLNEYTLLLGYFSFMTHDYHRKQHAISIQAGGLIPASQIQHEKKAGLIITDPFDLDDNLARST
ncbi:hypothetical protein L0F63_006572, partial [Massospora cicadina]